MQRRSLWPAQLRAKLAQSSWWNLETRDAADGGEQNDERRFAVE